MVSELNNPLQNGVVWRHQEARPRGLAGPMTQGCSFLTMEMWLLGDWDMCLEEKGRKHKNT
jgi:hypothetical protein